MISDRQTITVTQQVNAPAAEVYHAFTNTMVMRQWLADDALSHPHSGGRFYLAYERGYYANGEWIELQRNHSLSCTWHGRGEPAATHVEILLTEQNSGTKVAVTHTGIGIGKQWNVCREALRSGWESCLENLQSVLETGLDLRLVRRPMLGIYLGEELTPDLAAKLGVSVTEGVYLEGTIEGLGAQAAGLQAGDVLVAMGGKPITGYSSFGPALAGHHGGDEIEVEIWRGAQRLTLPMTLSKRPMPEYPTTQSALALALRSANQEVLSELRALFSGVSEEEAAYTLGPDEWSAKQVLAHLVSTERAQHVVVALAVRSQTMDEWGSNESPYLHALMAAYPTIPDLQSALEVEMEITAAMVEALPDSVVARKATFRRLAEMFLETPAHTRTHIDQMRESLAKVRESESVTMAATSSN